jgi:HEPN domain-containing protein
MKQTTKDWLIAANDDLLAAQTLAQDFRLTNLAAFHCQQCIEKCLKAFIEESGKPSIKSHDLIRLQLQSELTFDPSETKLLGIINEVYIDSRYPGDMGLLPHGKPTISEIETFIHFSETLLNNLKIKL